MNRIVITFRDLRWRLRGLYGRYRRAWLYARRSLRADDAQIMILDCQLPAGWHPLTVLTVEDTLKQALETFQEHPELERLIADGCARVGHKWEDFSDTLYEARRWAIDAAQDYAANEGIVLALCDDDTDDTEGAAG